MTQVGNMASTTELALPSEVYRHLIDGMTRLDAAALGTYILGEEGVNVLATGAQAGTAVMYLDPADYVVGALTTKYRIRANLLSNAVASTRTFTTGLYPVSASLGAAGIVAVTLGTVVAGSIIAFTTPAASGRFQGVSSEFTAPVAGYYVLGVALTGGAMAASSAVAIRAVLQVREV